MDDDLNLHAVVSVLGGDILYGILMINVLIYLRIAD